MRRSTCQRHVHTCVTQRCCWSSPVVLSVLGLFFLSSCAEADFSDGLLGFEVTLALIRQAALLWELVEKQDESQCVYCSTKSCLCVCVVTTELVSHMVLWYHLGYQRVLGLFVVFLLVVDENVFFFQNMLAFFY